MHALLLDVNAVGDLCLQMLTFRAVDAAAANLYFEANLDQAKPVTEVVSITVAIEILPMVLRFHRMRFANCKSGVMWAQTWHGAIQPSWSLCVWQPQLVFLLTLAILAGAAGATGSREVFPDGVLSLLHLLCPWLSLAHLQTVDSELVQWPCIAMPVSHGRH